MGIANLLSPFQMKNLIIRIAACARTGSPTPAVKLSRLTDYFYSTKGCKYFGIHLNHLLSFESVLTIALEIKTLAKSSSQYHWPFGFTSRK